MTSELKIEINFLLKRGSFHVKSLYAKRLLLAKFFFSFLFVISKSNNESELDTQVASVIQWLLDFLFLKDVSRNAVFRPKAVRKGH